MGSTSLQGAGQSEGSERKGGAVASSPRGRNSNRASQLRIVSTRSTFGIRRVTFGTDASRLRCNFVRQQVPDLSRPYLYDGSPPAHQSEDEEDKRDHQQHMHERADGVSADNAKQPQYKQDDRERIEHTCVPPFCDFQVQGP